MIVQIGIFLVGLVLLIGGAWALVQGGKQVAAVLGVPSVVVGLTVVAFGTSAPELFVSLVGALRGNAGLALGNVVGSNVANLGLILAIAAILRPVSIEGSLIRPRGEVPQMVLATFLLIALVSDGELSRIDAAVLVICFGGFMYGALRSGRTLAVDAVEMVEVERGHQVKQTVRGSALVVAGVLGLAGGGQLIVTSALEMATRLGVSETLIGLTLVAVGTSLPELATTIVAAAQRESDLALGNVIGSNLFNILAVAGPVGLVQPLAAEAELLPQLLSMGGITIVVALLLHFGRGTFGRGRGWLTLAMYAGIMALWVSRS